MLDGPQISKRMAFVLKWDSVWGKPVIAHAIMHNIYPPSFSPLSVPVLYNRRAIF